MLVGTEENGDVCVTIFFLTQRFRRVISALHKDKGGPMGPPDRWVSWSIPD